MNLILATNSPTGGVFTDVSSLQDFPRHAIISGLRRERWGCQFTTPMTLAMHQLTTFWCLSRMFADASPVEKLAALCHDLPETIFGEHPRGLRDRLYYYLPDGSMLGSDHISSSQFDDERLPHFVRAMTGLPQDVVDEIAEVALGPRVRQADNLAACVEALTFGPMEIDSLPFWKEEKEWIRLNLAWFEPFQWSLKVFAGASLLEPDYIRLRSYQLGRTIGWERVPSHISEYLRTLSLLVSEVRGPDGAA